MTFTNDLYPKAVGDWDIVPTTVKKGASIGAGAVIVCGVTIGENALVGAGAVVTRDVPRGLGGRKSCTSMRGSELMNKINITA